MSGEQAAVLEWLAGPAGYPGHPERVDRIDTHSASVFLAGDRAYKVKRAVRYSFLDFSTLERRHHACEAEVRLNRRTAPRLYVGAMPVTREPSGELAIGGEGLAVEWLVVMRRFAQEQLLDRLAAAGGITSRLVERLADQIAGFHAGAAHTPGRGGLAGMRDVVEDNARALSARRGSLDARTVDSVIAACASALERHALLLEARRTGGFVRQCHGDLHLRNIVLMDEVPTLFDAIEFNEDFACIDVWYDLAFLIMDLLARGLTIPANALFNQYLSRTGDRGGLPLLSFFLGCRAAIRAKTSLASLALEQDEARRGEWLGRASEYLDLASRLLEPAPPVLAAVGGLSGSGKSTVAAALAPALGTRPGAVVLRSDVMRKALLHRTPEERLGPEGYTAQVTTAVYDALCAQATDVVRSGFSVIADATFVDPADRARIAAAAGRAGVPFFGFWLDAPSDQLAERLSRREGDVSDATVDVLHGQLASGPGEIEWQRLDATAPVAEVVAAIRKATGAG